MKPTIKLWVQVSFSLILVAGIAWALVAGLKAFWHQLFTLNPSVAVGIVTGASTIIVATMTVMLGRYYERKREIEAHFRTKKIEIYDEFLKELFKIFHAGSEGTPTMVPFFQEWNRKLVLWGGTDVLRAYFRWKEQLKSSQPNAEGIFLMDDFLKALRSDIGQSSFGMERGAFSHLILRNAGLFLKVAKKNPQVTLAEFAEFEKNLERQDLSGSGTQTQNPLP